jgi:hypothetical protein
MVDECRRVDTAQDVVVVRLRLDPVVAVERAQDPVDPLRYLGAVRGHPHPDLAHRLVATCLG